MILEILSHKGHEHPLHLSSTRHSQNCSSCDFESSLFYDQNSQVLRCATCEFALDFKCATLPLNTRYKQHEHPFTLSYAVEDDSGEYYCDICEEERDPKHCFIIVQIVAILLILNVFLENSQILSLEVLIFLTVTHTHSLSLRKLMTTLNVTNVVSLAKSFSTNVPCVISAFTKIVYGKDRCNFHFHFHFVLHLVQMIFGLRNLSNENAVVIFNALSWHHDSDRT